MGTCYSIMTSMNVNTIQMLTNVPIILVTPGRRLASICLVTTLVTVDLDLVKEPEIHAEVSFIVSIEFMRCGTYVVISKFVFDFEILFRGG